MSIPTDTERHKTMAEKKLRDSEASETNGKHPYEAPNVESVQLTKEAAEALT